LQVDMQSAQLTIVTIMKSRRKSSFRRLDPPERALGNSTTKVHTQQLEKKTLKRQTVIKVIELGYALNLFSSNAWLMLMLELR
jgi:hypothetical protein